MASNDPHFEEKAAAIVGWYLNPPQNAAVLCVDEKSAIQALDRLDRRLGPLNPGTSERIGPNHFQLVTNRWATDQQDVKDYARQTLILESPCFTDSHDTRRKCQLDKSRVGRNCF